MIQSCSCHLDLAHGKSRFSHINLEGAEPSFALTEIGGMMFNRFLLIVTYATEVISTPLQLPKLFAITCHVSQKQIKILKAFICFHPLDVSYLASCNSSSPCRYSQPLIPLKPQERWDQLKRARGCFLIQKQTLFPCQRRGEGVPLWCDHSEIRTFSFQSATVSSLDLFSSY